MKEFLSLFKTFLIGFVAIAILIGIIYFIESFELAAMCLYGVNGVLVIIFSLVIGSIIESIFSRGDK